MKDFLVTILGLFWFAAVADWAATPNSSFGSIGHRKGTVGFLLFLFGPLGALLYLLGERPQLLELP